MKNLFISELLLLSQIEKKAKKVVFQGNRTLIFGKNDTGKSSLIKSIYRALGAETPLHPNWKKANVTSLIKFRVDSNSYSVLRRGKTFAIFDAQGLLIEKFDSVTKGLGLFLAKIFGFRIELPNTSGEFITPPPAYLFLPFYIDQDESWSQSWNSFLNLKQIKSYREAMINYHAGLRPNEYYDLIKEKASHSKKISSLDNERMTMTGVMNEINKKLAVTDFNINIESFKEDVNKLLNELEQLKQRENKLKNSLIGLFDESASLQSQISIVKHAIQESKEDFEFATALVDEEIECPTCGYHYTNSFADRFHIAQDEQRCSELLESLELHLLTVQTKIKLENRSLNDSNLEAKSIKSILESNKETVKFQDLLYNLGREELRNLFNERRQELNQEIQNLDTKSKTLAKQIKALSKKERKDGIINDFKTMFSKFLEDLEVNSISEIDYSKITTKIESKETGSSRPRALIAYYFTFFYLIQKYSTSTYCPIIIDSPNQQAQDIEHIDKILKFINLNQPQNTQMILGLEELYGVDFDCQVIELKNKRSLLQQDEFNSVFEELSPFLNQIWFG